MLSRGVSDEGPEDFVLLEGKAPYFCRSSPRSTYK